MEHFLPSASNVILEGSIVPGRQDLRTEFEGAMKILADSTFCIPQEGCSKQICDRNAPRTVTVKTKIPKDHVHAK